jgi:ABC-type glycerol-3-phosphate transport system substrate-binding protein
MPFPLPDDIASYPEARADMGNFYSSTASTVLIANAKTKHPDLVKKLFQYIYSEEGIQIMRDYKLTMPLDLNIDRDVSKLSYYQKNRLEAYDLSKIAVTDVVSPFGQYYETDIHNTLLFYNMQGNPFTGRFYNYYSEAGAALGGVKDAAKKALNMTSKLDSWNK